MPRVVLTDRQRKREMLAGVLAKYQAIYNLEHSEVATSIGMSRDTYRLRRKNPDKFTLGEIKGLSRTLRIPKEELVEALL